jgi:RNA polymerase sigma-70 factor (ECF subfamily)
LLEKLRGHEAALLVRLRSGDGEAFASLVDDLHGRLLAFAKTFTPSVPLAEDIVQETWLAVIRGLRGFEGRSSLRTWIFNILARRARTLAAREARRSTIELRPGEIASDPFLVEWEPGAGRLGLWDQAPVSWGIADPATTFQSREMLDLVRSALDDLPERQRQVVLLRDVEDLGSVEVCNILEISETNQRVLLHRGRARVRRILDRFLREGKEPSARSRAWASSRLDGRSAFPRADAARARGTLV